MFKSVGRPWFAPKWFGIGSGLPISWQGWVTLAVYTIALIAALLGLRGSPRPIAVAGLTAILLLVCMMKTRGGWRWRNGGE